MRIRLLFLTILLLPGLGLAQIAPGAAWNDASMVRVDMDFPGQGYSAIWRVHRCDCGDLYIESELTLPGEVHANEMLLVSRTALLSRGFDDGETDPVQAIDAPALMMQLALLLLERSAGGGPAKITDRTEVDFEEPMVPLTLDTGQAVGAFPAPWSVRGVVQPVSETARAFRLQFEFDATPPGASERQSATMLIGGLAEFERRPFPLAPDLSLEGWQLDWRDAGGAAADGARPETLGELRQALAE